MKFKKSHFFKVAVIMMVLGILLLISISKKRDARKIPYKTAVKEIKHDSAGNVTLEHIIDAKTAAIYQKVIYIYYPEGFQTHGGGSIKTKKITTPAGQLLEETNYYKDKVSNTKYYEGTKKVKSLTIYGLFDLPEHKMYFVGKESISKCSYSNTRYDKSGRILSKTSSSVKDGYRLDTTTYFYENGNIEGIVESWYKPGYQNGGTPYRQVLYNKKGKKIKEIVLHQKELNQKGVALK